MSKRFILIFIGLICGVFAETNTPNGKTFELFLLAEYERLNENYPSALSKYKSVLRSNKSSSTLHKTIAEIYFQQGNNSKALNHLQSSFELDKHDIQAGVMLFQSTLFEGDTLESEVILDTLIYHNPEEIEFLYYKADLQVKQLKWNGLIDTYKKIFIQNPSNTELLQKIIEIGKAIDDSNILKNTLEDILDYDKKNYVVLQALAQFHYTKGDLESAVKYFVKMIPVAEDKLAVLLAVSDIYLRINKPKVSLTYLEPLLKTETNSFDILHLALIAYTAVENSEKQIEIGQLMIEYFPEKPTGFETLAYAYIENEAYVDALNILDDAISRFPEKSLFFYLIGSIHRVHKSYNNAKQYFASALDLTPDSRTIRYALATVSEELLDFSLTDSLFELIISNDENDVGALNDYAYIISERNPIVQNKLEYALGLATRAVEESPENPAFLDTIGWIYFRLNKFDKAHEFIQKSIELDSDNTIILEHYGDVLVKIGDFDTAKNMYKKALEIDSSNLILRDKIEQIKDE